MEIQVTPQEHKTGDTITKYITVERANQLENSVGWLSTYTGSDNGEKHVIGNNITDINAHLSSILFELGELNKKRKAILDTFKKTIK